MLVDQPRLHRYSVMQLTMPTICGKLKEHYIFCLPSAREIRKMGAWQAADFTGNAAADSSTLRQIQRHLRAMQNYSTTSGLRIHFYTQARYGSLVDALDELNQYNIPKYFIDIHSWVTTLYVLPLRRPVGFDATAEAETSPAEIPPAATTGVRRWLDRINSHLQSQAWGTVLLAGLSVWLLVALGQWWLQEE
ncbi:hypothetical protein [Hymenobacter sp. YC55]|uniref:hypothetical protein n=1 Tax=Hymenobacter sp. YC55 TaxID=3034019 RepID=UPI0023F62665|nr:hypothetical protein [Hymenobacter sp. YC55]